MPIKTVQMMTNKWIIVDEAKPTSVFKQQYDKTQKKLEQIAAMDDLLSGIHHWKCR